MKEAFGFGLTVDEARRNAIKNLNVSYFMDVKIEIIDFPIKKKLGLFGGRKAKVRAYTDDTRTLVEIAEDYWGDYYPVFKRYWGPVFFMKTKAEEFEDASILQQGIRGFYEVIEYQMGKKFFEKFMFFIKNINEKDLAEQSSIVDYFNSGKCNYIIDEVAAEKGIPVEHLVKINKIEFENYELSREQAK